MPPNFEASATNGDTLPPEPSATMKKFPLLYELVADPTWSGQLHKGKRRLMVFFEGTIVKVMVGIETQRCKAMISARSLDDAFAAWEQCLKTNQVPWEQEQDPPGPAKGKKK